jgi:hypothetical protein
MEHVETPVFKSLTSRMRVDSLKFRLNLDGSRNWQLFQFRMSKIHSHFLRDSTEVECCMPLQDILVRELDESKPSTECQIPSTFNQPLMSELTLRNTSVKRTKESGARVYLFDILDSDERVGLASLIDEDSSQIIQDYGHVCVTLSEKLSSARLLAGIGKVVFDIAFQTGLNQIRVVVPSAHCASIEACVLLHPSGPAESHTVKSESFLVYKYLPD